MWNEEKGWHTRHRWHGQWNEELTAHYGGTDAGTLHGTAARPEDDDRAQPVRRKVPGRGQILKGVPIKVSANLLSTQTGINPIFGR